MDIEMKILYGWNLMPEAADSTVIRYPLVQGEATGRLYLACWFSYQSNRGPAIDHFIGLIVDRPDFKFASPPQPSENQNQQITQVYPTSVFHNELSISNPCFFSFALVSRVLLGKMRL